MIVDKGSHSVKGMALFVSSRNNSRRIHHADRNSTVQGLVDGCPQFHVQTKGQEGLVESSVDHQRR